MTPNQTKPREDIGFSSGHDPGKWKPVFRKDHAQTKKIRPGHDSTRLSHVLAVQKPNRLRSSDGT
jgi:hypothetical protein